MGTNTIILYLNTGRPGIKSKSYAMKRMNSGMNMVYLKSGLQTTCLELVARNVEVGIK